MHRAWQDSLGELAYPYAQLPYSGSGCLMARYMGVEQKGYAIHDQVPIDAPFHRIAMLPELVERYGRY